MPTAKNNSRPCGLVETLGCRCFSIQKDLSIPVVERGLTSDPTFALRHNPDKHCVLQNELREHMTGQARYRYYIYYH